VSDEYSKAPPLSPRQIREYELPYLPRTRRGLDPEVVRRLLYRLAEQIAAQNIATNTVAEENHRIKQALQRWQTAVAHQPRPPGSQQDARAYPLSPPYDSSRRIV
jgi:hypothetical protein